MFKQIIIINNLTIISIMFKINNYKLIIITFIDNLINISIFKMNNLCYLYFLNERTAVTFKLKFKINNITVLLLIGDILIIIIILTVLHL